MWAKIVTWFFTTFTASSIKEKVHFLSGIQYLYDWIDPDQLEIPAFVLEYDMKVSTVFQVIKFSYATLSLSACERRCVFQLLFHALSNESRKGRLLRKRPNFSCMHPNRSQICSRLDKIYPSDGEIVYILIFCFVLFLFSFQFSVWFFKNNIVTLFFSGKVSWKIAAWEPEKNINLRHQCVISIDCVLIGKNSRPMPWASEKPLSYCKIAYYMPSGSNRLRALHPLLTFLCFFLSFLLSSFFQENGNNYHTPASTYRTGSL